MNKEEMVKVIDRYATANAEKKTISEEVSSLSEAIKAYFTDRRITLFQTDNNLATVSYRKNRTVDMAKVMAKLGGKIPEDCYVEKVTPVLTIKAVKKVAVAVEHAINAA